MECFADTWFYVALLDRRDENHERVETYANALAEIQVTTRWVLAEVANMLCEDRARPAVAAFLRRIESEPLVRVVRESDDLFERGLALYEQRPDKHWSLTDCISFVVMKEVGLRAALTNDRHFAQAGFDAVFASRS